MKVWRYLLLFASLYWSSDTVSAQMSPSAVSAQVDAMMESAWKAQELTPAPLTSDAAFLRRVTLDLTGMLPGVNEVRKFLKDTQTNKRSDVINELLNRPRHATHLANIWRKMLLPRSIPEESGTGLERWVQQQFLENRPYDDFVWDVLTTQGSVTQSPQAIYYAALDTKPEQLAASVSSVFLGVQIRCAECHDHPFTAWKQEDFWSQAAFFAQVRGPAREGGVPVVQDVATGDVKIPKTTEVIAPRFLDGTMVQKTAGDPRRAQLARWIANPDNEYFARATVNRIWSTMFGRGLVDPVDDQGDHNPATHPAILDLLAKDFVEHNFNVRRMFRVLAETDLYQRTSRQTADADTWTSYTSMPVRSMSAKQTFDCLLQAARRREPLDPTANRLIEERLVFLASVDAPTQQATEFQGGIPQALTLLNGEFVSQLTDPDSSDFVVALVDNPYMTDERRIETLFLSTLSRVPNDAEQERSLKWLKQRTAAGDKAQALGDILWALINSSEFLLIQ